MTTKIKNIKFNNIKVSGPLKRKKAKKTKSLLNKFKTLESTNGYKQYKKQPVIEKVRNDHAISILGDDNLVLYHTTSTYPTDLNEINLNVIKELKERYNCPIGYSGHERGVMPSVLAVAYGAVSVERHITLDRTMFGSDQVASLEPQGLYRLVRDIRQVPIVSGDGVKKVYTSELPIIKKLRRKTTVNV